MSNDTTITINDIAIWLREHSSFSPRFLRLDLGNGKIITWELEARTGSYILKKEEQTNEEKKTD